MNKMYEFVEAFWVECLVWAVIAASGATLATLLYVLNPNK